MPGIDGVLSPVIRKFKINDRDKRFMVQRCYKLKGPLGMRHFQCCQF